MVVGSPSLAAADGGLLVREKIFGRHGNRRAERQSILPHQRYARDGSAKGIRGWNEEKSGELIRGKVHTWAEIRTPTMRLRVLATRRRLASPLSADVGSNRTTGNRKSAIGQENTENRYQGADASPTEADNRPSTRIRMASTQTPGNQKQGL